MDFPGSCLPSRPSGTVAFLFTDIEGSTRLWETQKPAMQRSLSVHDALLRAVIESCGGYVFKTVGDAFCASFGSASEAIEAAVEAQRRCLAESWEVEGGIRVRMAVHAGVTDERDGDYFGPVVNRTARILSVAYGSQILVSLVGAELIRDHLPPDCALKPLGNVLLKSLSRPEPISQLLAPGLPEDFPPPLSLDRRPNNLPLQPTSLIGRTKDIEAIGKLLLEEDVRLLTLTGMGGIGKTRLAVQAAAEILDYFEHGAWFADLSECRNFADCLAVLNRIFFLKENSGSSPLDLLKGYLEGKSLLLVMDNLEQVEGIAGEISGLLSSAPSLRILATSRVSLNLRWERLFQVSPLEMPERLEALPELKALSQYETVALFISRSCAANPGFLVTNENAPALAQVCWKLEGIPLAVELAAARSRTFSPGEILERLEARLQFLSDSILDLPAHQRTLRAALEWSHELLTDAEARAFRILSIFASSFDIQAAETVADEPELGLTALVESLVSKSLLVREEESSPARYRMLEVVKEFGRERLKESGEEEPLLVAHANYYLYLAECGRELPEGRLKEAEFYRRRDLDYPNYLAAIRHFEAVGDWESVLRVANGFSQYWRFRGMYEEGIRTLENALEHEDECAEEVVGKTYQSLGNFYYGKRDEEKAVSLLDKSVSIFENLDRLRDLVESIVDLGFCEVRRKKSGPARTLFERAITMSTSDSVPRLQALSGLAALDVMENNLDEAEKRYVSCEEGFSRFGEEMMRSGILNNLGIVYTSLHKSERALDCFLRAFASLREIGDWDDLLKCCNNIGCLENAAGRFEAALERYRELEEMARKFSRPRYLALALAGISENLVAVGKVAEALAPAEEAARYLSMLKSDLDAAYCLRVLAQVKAKSGCSREAHRLLGESRKLLNKLPGKDPMTVEEGEKLHTACVETGFIESDELK